MKRSPEESIKWISVGYGIFALGCIGIAVVLFSIADWRGLHNLTQELKAMSDIAVMIVIGFIVNTLLCIGSWNLLRMPKAMQYLTIVISVGVATLLVMNILPQWLAWVRGDIPEGVSMHQMLSSSGFPVGYAYLACMLVYFYWASNNCYKAREPE
jgi:hypothetical protein